MGRILAAARLHMSIPSQSAHADGSGNIIVQAAGNGISISLGQPHLTLVPPRDRRPRKDRLTELDLLNPYLRSIPLVGREADMAALWSWLHSDRAIAVRTLTGRAGAGKTRAAIELIEQLNRECAGRWWAGFVSGRELNRFAAQQSLTAWGWAKPTLVVVDYAAALTGPLRDWLVELAQRPDQPGAAPLRVLLLEREASTEAGWLRFLLEGGQAEARLPELFDPLEPKRLDRLETPDHRRAVLGNMLAAAAKVGGVSPPRLPPPGENAPFDAQLASSVWNDPLYLMMAALLSLRSNLVQVLALPRTELALGLATHEAKRLTELAQSPQSGWLGLHLAAFVALGDGLDRKTALTVVENECAALRRNCEGGAAGLVDRMHQLLPAPDFGLAPIVPDILAEALVLMAFSRLSRSEQDAAIKRAVGVLGNRVVPFIVRAVQDFAPAGKVEPLNWLEVLIVTGMTDDLGLLTAIESALPEQTLVLREKAAEITAALVARVGKFVAENRTESLEAEHGRLLNNLANRLSYLGRPEEALEKAEEAVRIYWQLAQARPDLFSPELATGLNNLANLLSDLGRREGALEKGEEAVEIFGQLAEARPDAFLPDLASALNNLANLLSDLGRREEALEKAEEVVRIYGQLATARPDAFLPHLASTLNNLANRLSDLGRREEALEKAEEAVRICGQLAEVRPDAFLSDLAMSLNNLATLLSDLERREEALAAVEEAVRIYGRLAAARPEAFLPDVAMAFNNLATMLSDLGRREEALAAVEESARIYRQLATARPEAFLPRAATVLSNLANRLSDMGRLEEALATAEEAVEIRRQLVVARPDAFLPNLAQSCYVRGRVLAVLGRHRDAADSLMEGIRCLTPFFQKLPQAFAPLIVNLCRDYLTSAKEAQLEPDEDLLGPVVEALKRLKPDEPKE